MAVRFILYAAGAIHLVAYSCATADSPSLPTAPISDWDCGRAATPPLIDDIGVPHDALPHSWPWTAAVCHAHDEESGPDCLAFLYGGATIIGPRWLIGPASLGFGLDGYRVRVGAASRYEHSPLHRVEAVIDHPLCDPSTGNYAIGLYRLESPLAFDAITQPICVPTNDDELRRVNETRATMIGWTRTLANATIAAPVQQMQVETAYVVPGEEDWLQTVSSGATDRVFNPGAAVVDRSASQRWFIYAVEFFGFGAAAEPQVASSRVAGSTRMVGMHTQINLRVAPLCDWIFNATGGEVECVKEKTDSGQTGNAPSSPRHDALHSLTQPALPTAAAADRTLTHIGVVLAIAAVAGVLLFVAFRGVRHAKFTSCAEYKAAPTCGSGEARS